MNKVIIFAAPSGSGKTSIVKELLKSNSNLKFSISATTRPMRNNEVDGKDYHFISADEFKDKIKNGDFFEYQEVYDGVFYGTLNSELNKIWESNGVVLFDVDVIGGVDLKNKIGDSALSIFVKAPNIESLKERLISRSTDSEESIKIRLSKASSELKYETKYDYVLVNDDFNNAVSEVKETVSKFIDK